MITEEKDFILTVKLYLELYNCYKIHGLKEHKDSDENWKRFARENKFQSDPAAESKWRKLVANYISFLVYGTSFAYEKEMQFMQMPLLSAMHLGDDDTQSESDIDEEMLKTVLNTYEDDDGPTDNKRQCIEAADVSAETYNNENFKIVKFDYGEEKQITHSSEVTNTTSKVHAHLIENALADNNKNVESHGGEDGKLKKIETFVQPTIEPPTISANIADDTQSMSGGFTNLTSLELIFLGYAKVLQRMPKRLQLQTKRKIADIMDYAELQMLEDRGNVNFIN
ncbi:uncharacterized protein [Eurosta solidaginis]|uniref:uncharacterized protein isoform X2 n=1 Tax=Eurosta solidaginis TaxID=178769 RepID=UPI0035308341